jgi:hypothetical protein
LLKSHAVVVLGIVSARLWLLCRSPAAAVTLHLRLLEFAYASQPVVIQLNRL